MKSFLVVLCMVFALTGSASAKTPITHAKSYVGLHEVKNKKTLQALLGINPRRTAWCAAFVSAMLKKSGYKYLNTLRSRDYTRYGKKVSTPKYGDIVVFSRKKGGHVGFFLKTIKKNGRMYYEVLGGNQSNKVKTSLFPASRAISFRRPVK